MNGPNNQIAHFQNGTNFRRGKTVIPWSGHQFLLFYKPFSHAVVWYFQNRNSFTQAIADFPDLLPPVPPGRRGNPKNHQHLKFSKTFP